MKKFRANVYGEFSINEVDVERGIKNTSCASYFGTFKQAKDYLLGIALKNIENAEDLFNKECAHRVKLENIELV